MTKHHIFYPLLGLALLLCGVWIAKQEIAQARAEERSKAHEDNQKVLDEQKKQNDAQLKVELDQLEAARKKPATIQTITKFLPAPLSVGSEVKIENLPDSPVPQLVVTGDAQKNLQAIQGMEIAHLECDRNLDTCRKNAVIADNKFKEMTADRDNWEQTAKGGSKTHRFFKVLKVVGCAGGGAAIGSLAKWKGAAVGAAAGAATCSIF